MTPAVDALPAREDHGSWRPLLLLLIVVGFAHVALGLGAKDLWWDESLSLQRAESSLFDLVRGLLVVKDGVTLMPTIDQHPFFSFLLQGIVIRLAGESEFSLRFVSAASVTLLVPVVYCLSALFARRGVIPGQAPLWSALLAALSPFFLWYGQEARPYALWATLAVLSTYLLLALTEDRAPLWSWRAGYAVALVAFLATHYYAAFLLPVQALILYLYLARRNRLWAMLLVAAFLAAALALAALLYWIVVSQDGGGNFSRISLTMLLPDLINAFSMGLSVRMGDVIWLDLLFAVVAATGLVWMMRSRAAWRAGGWIVAAALATPIVILLVANVITPVYMNARHMSLMAGFFAVALGAGLGAFGRVRKWAPWPVALVMLAGFGWSTFNYWTAEEYAKDDYARFGDYVRERVMPGDTVIMTPPTSWRIFDYYADMDRIYDAMERGVDLEVYGAPVLDQSRDQDAWLASLGEHSRRIWVFKGHPYFPDEQEVLDRLREHYFQVRDVTFFSNTSLHAFLFLPRIPAYDKGEAPPIGSPAHVTWGDLIHLAGYEVDDAALQAQVDDLPLPVRLDWQAIARPEKRYKYIVSLISESDGHSEILGSVEHEPYEGDIPTIYWDPGKTISELVSIPHRPIPQDARLSLVVQVYDADTLEKLPVTESGGSAVDADGFAVRLEVPD